MENKGIGPKEVISIMGLSKYQSRMQLFLEKVGEVKKEKKEPSFLHDEMQRLLANEFRRQTEKKVYFRPEVKRQAPLIGVQNYVVEEEDGTALLDVRTVSEFRKKDFDRDDVPVDHLIRLHHNMKVFGYRKAYLAVLIGGRTFLHRTVEREEVICDTIVDACQQFWKHIEEGTMPELDGSTASEQYLKQRYPEGDGETHLPKEAMSLIEQFRQAKAEEEAAKEEKNQAANKLKALMSGYERGYIGTQQVTWKNVYTKRLDEKAFKEAHPDLYQQFVTERSYRRFGIK